MQSRVSGKIRNTVHPFVETCKRSHLEKSGARQLKSRKPLRKTQGQASFLDRRVRNMENRRGPLNRRIRRYSILQQLNFGDTSYVYIYIYMYVCLCVHHKCLFHHLANETWPRLGMMSWRCVARSSLPKWIATWTNSMTFRFWGFSWEHLQSCKRYGLIEVEGCNIRVRSLGHSVLQYAAPVCSGFDLFADGVVGCSSSVWFGRLGL